MTHQICLKPFCTTQLNEPKGKLTRQGKCLRSTVTTHQQMNGALYGYLTAIYVSQWMVNPCEMTTWITRGKVRKMMYNIITVENSSYVSSNDLLIVKVLLHHTL